MTINFYSIIGDLKKIKQLTCDICHSYRYFNHMNATVNVCF